MCPHQQYFFFQVICRLNSYSSFKTQTLCSLGDLFGSSRESSSFHFLNYICPSVTQSQCYLPSLLAFLHPLPHCKEGDICFSSISIGRGTKIKLHEVSTVEVTGTLVALGKAEVFVEATEDGVQEGYELFCHSMGQIGWNCFTLEVEMLQTAAICSGRLLSLQINECY